MATATEELLFRVRGDTAQAKSAFADLKTSSTKDISDIETQVTSLGTSGGFALESLAGPAAIATAAVAAVGAAALAAGKALFDLTVRASEYGSEIFDASEKTGLGAKTLTSLKFAAEQGGTSFDKVTAATAKFAKVVGDAADGSKEAAADLKAFGLEPQEAISDLEGSLDKVFEAIRNAKDGTEQMVLAQKAFGRSGADLLPMIKSMPQSLSEWTAECERLGITLDDETIRAADELGDSMDLVKTQIEVAGIQLGSIFMPILSEFFTSVSQWLADNKADWQFWGDVVRDAYTGAKIEFPAFGNIIVAAFTDIRTAINAATLGLLDFMVAGRRWYSWVLDPLNMAQQWLDLSAEVTARGEDRRGMDSITGGSSTFRPKYSMPRLPSGGGGGRAGRASRDTSAADAARAEREAQREQERIERERLEGARRSYQQQTEYFEAEARKRVAVAREYADAEGKTADDLARYEEFIAEQTLTFKKEKLEEYMKAVGAGTQEYADAQQKITILELNIEEMRAKHAKNEQERSKKSQEALDKEIEGYKKEADAIREAQDAFLRKTRAEAEARAKKEKEDARRRRLETTVGSGSEISAIQQLHDYFSDTENSAALAGLGVLTDAFNTLGQAIGNVVQAWVLYGSAGQSVRQVTAQILASIAQQAAVKAIFELAEGFAALALAFFGIPNAGPSATAHFTAAAVYGSIAGIAAVAGRAVAGDAFKKETSGSYGTAGQPRSQERNTSGQGQMYSSYGDNVTVIDQGRNAPNGVPVEVSLSVKDRSGWFADMFEIEINKNGKLRQAVINAAANA